MSPYLISLLIALGVYFLGRFIGKRFNLSQNAYLGFAIISFVLAFICHAKGQEALLKLSTNFPFIDRSTVIWSSIGLCGIFLLLIFFVEGRRKIDHNLNADIDEWKKIISEVFYCLEHYARWYGNIGSGNLNDMRKAYDALQQSAHRLIACANTLNYPIDRSRVEEAKALLLGISNTLIDGNILIMQRNHGYVLEPEESGARRIQSKENRENADRIKRLLQCAKKKHNKCGANGRRSRGEEGDVVTF